MATASAASLIMGDDLGGCVVAPACSGARSMAALALLALICCRRWRLVAALVAVVVAWTCNVARVCALVVASRIWGPTALDLVHDPAGYLSFLLAASLLVWIDAAVERRSRHD